MTVKDILEKYNLHQYYPDVSRTTLENIYSGLSSILQDDDWNDEESAKWNEMISEAKPISEVRVIRGGKEYKFKDSLRLELLAMWFKEELRDEPENFPTVIEQLRESHYNNPRFKGMSKRQRYLLIHDLLTVANFPFTIQQLHADDQAKAALIRTWMERNKKPKKSR